MNIRYTILFTCLFQYFECCTSNENFVFLSQMTFRQKFDTMIIGGKKMVQGSNFDCKCIINKSKDLFRQKNI